MGSRNYHWSDGFELLKLAQVSFADSSFVGGYSTNIIGILLDQIIIEIIERPPHLIGMFLIDAKYDCLGEAVSLFQKVRDVARDRLASSFQCHGALEIRCLILIVRDLATVAIQLSLARPPSCRIPLGDNAMNSVGREESVLDSLPQAIGINRIAEVPVSIAIVFSKWCRRHA